MKLIFLILILMLSGCVANAPFRTSDGKKCDHWRGCGSNYERHTGYDLGFIEFSERGHDFAPQQTAQLLSNIARMEEKEDVGVIVFIHGWKHNASVLDKNVKNFQKTLAYVAAPRIIGKRKLLGIYIGWRGMSFHGAEFENLTFWDRKSVAEEVGRNGVKDFLIKLESIVGKNNNNFMLTVGHSFGADILLSALNDNLLERMRTAENNNALKSFGDGLILLNPAVEANQALLLKESSMRLGAQGKPMPSLMYVISSRADIPTNVAFPVGQFFGKNIRWSQVEIERDYFGIKYKIKEQDLDDITVGNFKMFTTGYMYNKEHTVSDTRTSQYHIPAQISKKEDLLDIEQLIPEAINSGIIGPWKFNSYCTRTLHQKEQYHHDRLPCFDNDPIDFISVPDSFISNHNDIFNRNVITLLMTMTSQSLSNKKGRITKYCQKTGGFSFEDCFNYYYLINEDFTVNKHSKLY